MYLEAADYNQINNGINFGLRVRLSDKGLLNLPQKPDILYASTPLDFFYREPKNKQKLPRKTKKTI